MNFQSLIPSQIKLGVLPDIDQIRAMSDGPRYSALGSKSLLYEGLEKEKKLHDKYYNFSYATGILNTGLQALSGLMIMGLGIFGHKIKNPPKDTKMEKLFVGKSKKLYKIAASVLGAGYFIGFPAVTGAGIKAEQPGMVLASTMWFLASPLMLLGELGTRARAFLDIAYAPAFTGFANEINNEYGKEKDKKIRKMDLDFLLEKETYKNIFTKNQKGEEIRKRLVDFSKFCMEDQVNALKTAGNGILVTARQSFDMLTGKRDKLPDTISTKPSKESMSLGSLFILAGTIPKLIIGKKINGKLETAANIFIGSGFFFESIGMMTLANQKDDSRKEAMMLGGPMRIIGDFNHDNPFMYGLRTLGGSAFEYYWTLMNKDEKSD